METGKSLQKKQSKKKFTDRKTSDKKNEKKCTRCKLHVAEGVEPAMDSEEHRKNCPYLACENFLCRSLTTFKKLTMSVQLDIWRKRSKYIHTNKETKNQLLHTSKDVKKQLCDKCRNHFIRKNKKLHDCPFKNCRGIMCRFSDARCKIMSFFLKIQRSGVKCNDFQKHYQEQLAKNNSASTNVPLTKSTKRIYSNEPSTFTRTCSHLPQRYPETRHWPAQTSSYLQSPQYSPLCTITHYPPMIYYKPGVSPNPQSASYHPQSASYHPPNEFSHPISFQESSCYPSTKKSVGNYNQFKVTINYSNYYMENECDDKLRYPECVNGANNNLTTAGTSSTTLHRPWL